MLKEFREFALKGNVVDLAVGVVIGAAFGKIVDSLVNDIIMPIIGAITGGLDFSNYFFMLTGLRPSSDASLEAARKAGAVVAYGSFITIVVNFAIVAFVLFLVIKAMNQLKRRQQAAVEAGVPAPVPADVQLLTEIRDLLGRRPAV